MTIPRMRVRGFQLAALALAGLVLIPSCRRGPRDFDNENDTLRRVNLELTKEVETLRRERDEAQAKLAQVERMRSWDGEELAGAVRMALPRCADIEFGILSGAGDADDLPGFDVIDVYLIPRDGRGRFVQIVGTIEVRVDLLPEGPAEVRLLGTDTLGAERIREAYRSGLTGTHYSVRITPDQPVDAGAGSIAMSVDFTDALTGRVHSAREVVEVPKHWR